MPLRILAIGIIAVILSSSTAAAQNASSSRVLRDGVWVTVGPAGGWTRLNCAICRTDRNLGPAAAVAVGTSLRSGLLVGVELDGWTRSHDDVRAWLAAGGVSAYAYPDPARGFHLRAGVRYVRYRIDDDIRASLAGLVLGAGYEIPVGDRLSITNSLSLTASSFGRLRSGQGIVAPDVSLSMLQVGIALTRRNP